MARINADSFLEQMQSRLNFHAMWAGVNFAFGRNREGTVAYLESAGQQLGFEFNLIPPIYVGDRMVSSSRIRESVLAGDVQAAADCLGRLYHAGGEVVHGAARGRGIGFPTANLAVGSEKLLPRSGVYACWAEVRTEVLPAVVNLGSRPTFESPGEIHVEAHLLDAHRDLYGQTMILRFVEQIREEKKFASVDDLKLQIAADVQTARAVLDHASLREQSVEEF